MHQMKLLKMTELENVINAQLAAATSVSDLDAIQDALTTIKIY